MISIAICRESRVLRLASCLVVSNRFSPCYPEIIVRAPMGRPRETAAVCYPAKHSRKTDEERRVQEEGPPSSALL